MPTLKQTAAEPHAADPTRIREGLPFPLGATWDGLGVNFAIFSAHATKVDNYKLCKSMDVAAAHYFKTAGAKATKPSDKAPACVDPGPFAAAGAPAAAPAGTPAQAPAKPPAKKS